MEANKMFFDLYSTGGAKVPYEKWKKFREEHDDVYIVLRSAQVYCVVKREDMFERGLYMGCFVDSRPSDTPEEVRENALAYARKVGARQVTVDEFEAIEKAENERLVPKALSLAEQMIARG